MSEDLMLDVGQANEIKMGARRAQMTNEHLKRMSKGNFLVGVRKVLDGEARIVPVKPTDPQPLLESGDTFTLPAVTMHQSVAEAFAGCHLYGNFEKWFDKSLVEPQGQIELVYGELTRPSQDIPILGQLFGRHETTLTTVSALIKAQMNGEDGPLLTNGAANIFYIRDTEGELRTVRVYRGGRVWYVGAYSVSGRCDWGAGSRVFSL